jgi:hypothetical protein
MRLEYFNQRELCRAVSKALVGCVIQNIKNMDIMAQMIYPPANARDGRKQLAYEQRHVRPAVSAVGALAAGINKGGYGYAVQMRAVHRVGPMRDLPSNQTGGRRLETASGASGDGTAD